MQDSQAYEHDWGRGDVRVKEETDAPERSEGTQGGMKPWMADLYRHLGLREDDCCVKCGDLEVSLEHKRNHVKCIEECLLCETQDHPDSMCPRMLEEGFREVFTPDWFNYRLGMNGFPVAKPKGNPKPPLKGVPTGPNNIPAGSRGGLGGLGGRGGFGSGWSGPQGGIGGFGGYGVDNLNPPQPPEIPRHAPGAPSAYWRAYRKQEQDKKRKRRGEEVEVVGAMQAQEHRAENARRDWEEFSRNANMAERRMHEEEKKLEEMKAKAKADKERQSFHDQKAEIKTLQKRLADLEAFASRVGDPTTREKKLENDRMDFDAQREAEPWGRNSSILLSLPGSGVEESEPEESEPEETGDGIKLPIRRRNRRRDPSLDSLSRRLT